MAGPKKVTADEKRRRLLAHFHASKGVFQMKDVEKIGSKELGITLQSIKEVVQSLVDDNLVTAEKIGTSWYYWSFPLDSLVRRKAQIKDLEGQVQAEKCHIERMQLELEKAQQGKQDGEERRTLLDMLSEEEEKFERLKSRLDLLKDLDPETYRRKTAALTLAKEAVERNTDSIFGLTTFISDRMGRTKGEVLSAFELPNNFDYVEEQA